MPRAVTCHSLSRAVESSLKSKTLSVKKKCCMLVIVAYVESSSSIYIYQMIMIELLNI